ncbi:N-acyl-D-amino-acid deacylase family protein [Pseudonocardia alaniniphila]|uniref:D-aminoacylase n=1 Tax=Pseudonocardia alaniniphila TaxID=75291 RepID=A0ABS9TSL2_9PSEU|nr:D-aminoacylase [Pseudonocardia alaniniphila]MCH6171520.1 D-aminoacylase [Pseudonocardia alaniniphila]
MHDLVLKGGTVVDGTGAPARSADVGIRDGRIAEIGRIARSEGQRYLDVSGAVVCPGFIDLHSHADYTVFAAPEAVTQSAQGVTTLVTGNCGFSPFPVVPEHAEELRSHGDFLDDGLTWEWSTAGEYADAVDRLPLGVNIAPQVGHSALRIAVLGLDDRRPDDAELARMRELARAALADGAAGLSSGLIYAPASYAAPEELAAVAAEAARFGRVYSTHIRDEGDYLDSAIDEAIEVGRSTGVRVEISHLKAVGPANWGRVAAAMEQIAAARRDGVDIRADQYPYAAGSTTLTTRLPAWSMEGGVPELLRRLSDPGVCDRIVAELEADDMWSFLAPRIVVADTPEGPFHRFVGQDLATIAAAIGETPARAMLEVLRGQRGTVSIIMHGMAEDDVRTALADPAVAVASDGWVLSCPGDGMPHPRSFGTFVRVLGRYTRDEGLLDLPTAVAKMTSLPASRLGWTDRGVLRPGAVADIACFDPDRVGDPSTFSEPWQLAEGVIHTLLRGQPIWENGAPTGAAAGQVVRTVSEKGRIRHHHDPS